MDTHSQSRTIGWLRGPWIYTLLVFLGVSAFFLFTEHRAHMFGVLPYLFLLSCGLMHLFMHSNHNWHEEQSESKKNQSQQTPDSTHHH